MNKNAFTILEVIIAIFILSLAGSGTFILIQQTLIGASLNQMQLTAYYLGQEGAEIVRNIRDTNWLQRKEDWKDGISLTSDYQLDYQSLEFPDTDCNLGAGNYLKYDGNFYNCFSGSETKFKRQIIVTDETDYLQVRVIVGWSDRGKDYSVEVINHLYNWYDI